MPYHPNPGHLPPECVTEGEDGTIRYRNVHVRLFNGIDTRKRGDAPWPSGGGRVPTVWRISRVPHPYEIELWELA